ncbi:hypothetical protein E1B28_012940 [Marasmius oreades]|uniref:Uncharacterized protein n=1 Tax=Marasmius oreades TaxID=181124 RepID=A0A9P7RSM3_9AGAR|nr:uncharacterized protein E1B28_012940 [Marasmius oreades]KAG7088994.1 hypothetical protein E1B28_012940 [Marasmius oreades]
MASGDHDQTLSEFLTAQQVVILPIATLSAIFLVYGVYAIIFGLCIQILHRRKQSQLGLYRICTIVLFILASIRVVLDTYGYTRQAIIDFLAAKTRDYEPLDNYLGDDGQITWLSIVNNVAVCMNVVADLMLIHRCYILWGSRRVLLYTLGAVTIAINCIGFVGAILESYALGDPSTRRPFHVTADRMSTGWLIAIAVFNSLLSLLTGGRIWWISREARRYMGRPGSTRYKAIVSAIIESGTLYPATLIITTAIYLTWDPEAHGSIPVDLGPISCLMSGLAPTLVIVRVAYGKSVDSVQQVMSIHFLDQEAHIATTTDSSLNRRPGNNILEGVSAREANLEDGKPKELVDGRMV